MFSRSYYIVRRSIMILDCVQLVTTPSFYSFDSGVPVIPSKHLSDEIHFERHRRTNEVFIARY